MKKIRKIRILDLCFQAQATHEPCDGWNYQSTLQYLRACVWVASRITHWRNWTLSVMNMHETNESCDTRATTWRAARCIYKCGM